MKTSQSAEQDLVLGATMLMKLVLWCRKGHCQLSVQTSTSEYNLCKRGFYLEPQSNLRTPQ